MKLSDLSISTRLRVGFGALIAVFLVVAGVGTVLSKHQLARVYAGIDLDVQRALHALAARTEIGNLRRFEKDLVLNLGDAEKEREYIEKWRHARRELDAHLRELRQLSVDPADAAVTRGLSDALAIYEAEMEKVQAQAGEGALRTPAEGYRRIAGFRDSARLADLRSDELLRSSLRQVDALKPALERGEAQRQLNIAAGMVGGIVLALAVALYIARSITRPVRYAVQVAESLAQGDLTRRVEAGSRDDVGRLLQAMAGTVTQLAAIVGRIKETSDRVRTSSGEIAQANLDLSTRTEEQASALEESSASMRQMSATVGQNAESARRAAQLAQQASGIAERGGEAARGAVATMQAITESSKRIAEIIGLIDSIAFQTNILALNAAVEAARAGAQGRGFAVVAGEVRSLAQRSAAAAKEIKELIGRSAESVAAGARHVNETGHTMEEIIGAARQVSALIAEISKATQEQAQGIEQVSEAVAQLEHVTQQNAAMVEEASAAAGSLSDESLRLSAAVESFRLAGEPSAPAPRVEAPRAGARAAIAVDGRRTALPRAALAAVGPEEWTRF